LSFVLAQAKSLPAGTKVGYGNQGAGGVIKGGETLVFVVDLLNVN
jgi:FKBP-type peptidyl-prolyl cis-trans isomerase